MNILTKMASEHIFNCWYSGWEYFKDSPDASVRRRALKNKTRGVVGNDRFMIRIENLKVRGNS